jgi:hypothetical protein
MEDRMKSLQKFSWALLLLCSSMAWSQTTIEPIPNELYILQLGDLYPGDSAASTLYFTLFSGEKRVNSIDYYYNGNGYLRLFNRRVIANTGGSDGIIHHWDGDLLIGGQGKYVHKVNKNTGEFVTRTDTQQKSDNYHLFMDPDGVTMWGSGIPGILTKFSIADTETDHIGTGEVVTVIGDENMVTNLAWLEDGTIVYTRSHWDGVSRLKHSNKDSLGTFGKAHWKNPATRDTLVTERIHSRDGFHGMHYDDYSQTILCFGAKVIVQIDPISLAIIAVLDFEDLATYGFPHNKIRFDQGTTDGLGHIFVASNLNYMVFIDFTSNPLKRIDDNIVIHMQYIDQDLDDVAPLSGHGSEFNHELLSSGSQFSSSSEALSSNVFFSSSSQQESSDGTSSDGGLSSEGGDSSSDGTSSDGGLSSDEGGDGSSDGTSSEGGLSSEGGSSTSDGTSSEGGLSSEDGSSTSDGTSSEGGLSSEDGSSTSDGTSSEGGLSSEDGSSTSDGTSSEGGLSSEGGDSSSDGTSSEGGISGDGDSSSDGTSSEGGLSGDGDSSSDGTSSEGGLSGDGDSSSDGTSSEGGLSGDGDSSSDGTSSEGGLSGDGDSSSDGTSSEGGLSGDGDSSSDGTSSEGGLSGDGNSSSDGTSSEGGLSGDGNSSSDGTSAEGGLQQPNYDEYDYSTVADGGLSPEDSPGYYPDASTRDQADSVVEEGFILQPVLPGSSPENDTLIVGGNVYEKITANSGKVPVAGIEPGENNGDVDSIPIGSVMELVLDADRLRDFFGMADGDTMLIAATPGITVIDPSTGNSGASPDSIPIVLSGDKVSIWITGDKPLVGGRLFFVDPDDKKTMPFGDFMFYDPIPKLQISIIKDLDGDSKKDEVEVFLSDSLPSFVKIDSMQAVYNGEVISLSGVSLNESTRDRITANVRGTSLEDAKDIDSNDVVVLYFTDDNGLRYEREIMLLDLFKPVLESAYVLRGSGTGAMDSLFVDFHVQIDKADLSLADVFVLLNNQDVMPQKLRLIAKDVLVFEDNDYLLLGNNKDSLSLYPGLSLTNLPYIVSQEFNRKVPVTVIDRVPQANGDHGYYDSDGDGTMDSVVVQFADTITADMLQWMDFVVPWYTESNRIIYLNPSSDDLIIDPADPTKVSWKVVSQEPLKSNLTSVPEQLPASKLNIKYPIPQLKSVDRRTLDLADKMPPSLVNGKLKYATGEDKYDTLRIQFTEKVSIKNPNGTMDFLQYYHANGDTLTLRMHSITLSEDARFADILVRRGDPNGLFPGDSVFLACISCQENGKTFIQDMEGNVIQENSASISVDGSLTHLVETTKMGSFDPDDPALQEVASITISTVPSFTRSVDLEAQGEMGHLIELGGRFMPQLLQQIASNRGITDEEAKQTLRDSLNPEKVRVAVQAYYFDHNGQFVTDLSKTIPCTAQEFDGNCLTTDKKLFLKWNYKSKENRFVGSGVYVVNFKVLIRYDGAKVEEEMQERWGVIRGRGFHKH